MAEDDSRRDSADRLGERLEHLERLLQMHTERLHSIERRLGIDFQPPSHAHPTQRKPLYESSDETYNAPASPPTLAPDSVQNQPPAPDAPQTPTPGPSPFIITQSQRQPPPSSPSQPPPQGQPPPPPTFQQDARPAGGGASEWGWWSVGGEARGQSAAGETRAADEAGAAREAGASQGVSAVGAPRRKRDLELLVGGSLTSWVGIILLTFGVAFFLKLAFESEWVGPSARVALGAAGGLAILFAGDRLRARGYGSYAYVLSGGGILILYLSVYAAFGFYQLVSQTVAFLLMTVVTAGAVALSVRHDALPIAVLGLVGGFMTPVLLSTGTDNQLALFTYVALLDAGVLALAYFKAWRVLNYAVFLLTLVMITGWAERHYAAEKLWPTVFFLALFFLLFSAVGVVYNVVRRRPARWYDVLLVITNATFFFGLSYKFLEWAGYGRALGSFALVVAAFFVLLYYAAWSRHREDVLLSYSYLGAAATFAAIAVAVQLDLHWVTIGWSVEALMLVWVGLRARASAPRHAGLLVFAAALAHWFGWDMRDFAFQTDAAASFVPLMNRRALSCVALAVSLAAAARLYASAKGDEVGAEERAGMATFFVLAAVLAVFALLTLDTNDYFNYRLAGLAPEDATGREAWLEAARQLSLTVVWAFYGAAALALGHARRITLLRFAALLLLAATVLKALALDAANYAAPWHLPVFNQTFLALAWVVAALGFCAWLYGRPAEGVGRRERAAARTGLVGAANLLALAALSLEALGFFDRGAAGAERGFWSRTMNNKALALSIVWTLYGAGAHAYGLRRRSRVLRYGALALFTLTAAKLLLWDAFYYNAPWHTLVFNQTFASFALLVAALWFVVRSYARSPEIHEEELRAAPAVTVAANLLAVVALSAEAGGYFSSRLGAGGLSPDAVRDLSLAAGLSLSLVWAVYGGGLLLYGYLRRAKLQRVMGLVLLGLVTLKVFLSDLSSLDRIYRIVSFIVLGVILLAVSYLYQKTQRRDAAEKAGSEATGGDGDGDARSAAP